MADDIYVDSISLKIGSTVSQWPKLSCSQVNQLALEVSDLKLDTNREIFFDGNGQLRSSGDLRFFTGSPSATEKLSLLTNGNVGIGKLEPQAKLEVNGNLKIQQGVAVNEFSSDGTLSNNSDLALPTQKAVKTYVDAQITQVNQTLSIKAALAGASSQDFQTKNLTVSGNLTTTGNVGIGMTNPKAKLDVAGNINTTGIISGASLPPNLIRNSYMNILDGTKPAGYGVLGNVTLEAVHPFTKGFEGPYVPERPPNAATSLDTATPANPYWFGRYNKGSRVSRGGLADGWHSFSDGRILKITGNNSGDHTSVFFPFERNVLTNKVHFKAWLKISSGAKVGFGVDSGHLNIVQGLIITKQQTDAAPDSWYQIDALIDISEVTSLDDWSFSMGIEASGTFEVYLALPYLANLDNDTWLPSVSDMLSRDGLTVHPSSGNVGIGTASPTEKLHVTGGGIKIGATTIATPGIEVVREVLPLALATDNSFVDINGNGGWTPITRTIYSVVSVTTPLPGSQRKYKLVIRNGNNGIAQNGHISRYRLFFTWANQPDNKEYEGNLYWGNVNEGAWDIITLDHLANPSGQISYWRLEGYTSGCINRIFNVTIQVVDVIQ